MQDPAEPGWKGAKALRQEPWPLRKDLSMWREMRNRRSEGWLEWGRTRADVLGSSCPWPDSDG